MNYTSYTGTVNQAGVWNQGGLGLRNTQIFVNGYTGNLIVQDQDGVLAAAGTDLRALRTYNSRGSFNDDNGDNWIVGFVRQSMRLTAGAWGAAGSTVVVAEEDGAERLYTWVTNRYVSTTSSGPDTYLTLSGDGKQAIFSNGPQSGAFDVVTGRLLSWNSPTLLNAVFSYDASGHLTGMSADAAGTGGRIVYEYSGDRLQRVSVVDEQNRTVSSTLYAYDANGRLSRVSVDLSPADGTIADGKVYTTDYTYVASTDITNGMLRSIVNSDGTSQTFKWVVSEGLARLSQSWGADGQISTYEYNTSARTLRVTQPGGFTTDFWYDGTGRLKQSHPSKGANNGVTNDTIRTFIEYYTTDNQATFTGYDRGVTVYNYDADNNLILVRDAAGNTVRRTYVNRLVTTETVYAVADPDGNGTGQPAAPATTRYVYDAEGKLRFKLSPEGVVTELRYTGKLPTSTITYLGGAYNVSALTISQTPTEAQLATWVDGADKARTSRVDSVYDLRGQKLRETAYAATDAAGNGQAAGARVVVYAYDAAGRLLTMTDGASATVAYAYDGLGRVLSRQQGGILTSYVHQEGGSGYVSTVTEQNGLVTVSTYDKMGRLLGVSRTQNGNALGTTTNYYDGRGLLYKSQDATGVLRWYLYDERANKVAEIDGNGTVTEFRYDVAQRPIQTIVYATPLAALSGTSPNPAWADPPAVPTLAAIRPAESAKDQRAWTLYDAAGRPTRTVDAAGFVTETRYDGTGRVTGTVRYANAIDLAAFAASPTVTNATPLADADNDRVTRKFYSTEGRLQGELDAEGFLVEYRYDAAGRVIARLRYADPAPTAQRATGTLAQLRPAAASPQDQATRYVYDGQNRLLGEIDPEGYVTEQLYDDRGNVAQRTRYAAKLTAAQITAFDAGAGAWRPAATAGLGGDRTEFWHYNALGRLDEQTDADGTVTRFVFDDMGRVVSTTRAAGTAEARTQKVRYDALGRVIGELSARGAALLADGQTQSQVDAIWAQYGTLYTYDAAGRKTSQVVSDGASTQRTIFFYNEDGQLTHTINALGEVQENQYDGLGQLVKTIAYGGRLGATTLNALSGGLASTAIRNAVQELLNQRVGGQPYANAQTVFDYDARGRLKSTTDALGYTTSTSYNAFGEASSVTSQVRLDGTVVSQSLAYDRRGLLKARADDVGGLNALTKTEYDAFGRVVKTTDARNVESTIGYDRIGRAVQTVDGGKTLRTTAYDAFNRITATTDGNNQTTVYRYDLAARTVEVTTPENIKSRVTRNRLGEVETRIDGNNVATTYAYTENGELKTITTPLNATGTKYDSLGRVAESADANGTVTKFTYDALNRIKSRTIDDGGLTLTTSYDYQDTDSGTAVLTTEADGRRTLQRFDLAGRLVSVTVDPSEQDPQGLALTTRYELDANGRTLKVIDPNGVVTRYEYDKLGRRVAEITDAGASAADLNLTRTYAYDAAGRLASSTDWAGARTLYAYDDANRLVYQIDPMGAVRYTEYDGEGRERRVTRLATPLGASVLAGLGMAPTREAVAAQLTSMPAKDEVTGRVYDKDGRVKYSVDAAGTVVEFRYDGVGRVKQQIAYATAVADTVAWMDGGAAPPASHENDRVTSTLYDALGRTAALVDAEGGITVLAYDGAGNLRQKTAFARAADAAKMQALRSAGADWNAATLGTPATHAQDRVTNFRYDNAGRLRYEYDAEGFVTEMRYQGLKTTTIRYAGKVAVDAAPAPGADDHTSSVELDKAGRVLSTVDAMGVETRNEYDAGGRLKVSVSAYGRAEATKTGYVYDDAGHVVEKTLAQDTDAASTTRYGYDANGRLVTEVEARGVALASANSAWARAERLRQGKPEAAEQLTAADRQAFLDKYTTRHEYDAAGRRTATINAMGLRTSSEYDAFGNAVKVTDPLGNAGYFYFDKLNRVTLQVDPEGYAARTTYWGAGSNQIASVRRYYNRIAAPTVGQAPATTDHVKDALTTNAYDRLDRLTSTTDASRLATESTSYGVNGNRFDKAVTNKVGGTAVFNTDRLGNTVTEALPVTANGRAVVNRYGYDAFGNRTSSVEADGLAETRVTRYRYDKAGRLTHRIGTAYTAFDGASQTASTVIPVEWTRYDALGRVVEQVSRGNWVNERVVDGAHTFSQFDAAGNKIAQVAADGAYTAYEYDAAGHVLVERAMSTRVGSPAPGQAVTALTPSAVPAADRITRSSYDELGRLVEKTRDNFRYWEADPARNDILSGLSDYTSVRLQRVEYDAAGNVVREIDGRGNSVYTYYDKVGRKVLRIDQESYAVGWDYEGFQSAPTAEVKYAARVAAYSTQNDTARPVAVRDPAALRAGLSLTGARTTTFVLDGVGRVVERRVLGVASTYLGSSGAANAATMDAVSTFEYDGLGNVKKQRDLVGLTPDGNSQVWNETTIEYDRLGRETRRVAPGFLDYQGRWVTPVTETEYNGLGLVSRSIQRGLDAASESDDRITAYGYNANGDRTGTVDAAGNYTLLELDSLGRIGRSTAKSVLRADQTRVDIVKRYAYDLSGRVTAEYDGDATHLQTGEIRRTRYNVFGEITGKGLGDGWQEFAEYNVLGKVERNNSEGGAIAIFLYDRNGNTTRKIVSGVASVDLRNKSISDAAQDLVNLNHTFSVHDGRNQLLKTVEIAVDYQTDVARRRDVVTQQLAPLYGAIGTQTGTGGSSANQASGSGGVLSPQPTAGGAAVVPQMPKSGAVSGALYGPDGVWPQGTAVRGQVPIGVRLDWSGSQQSWQASPDPTLARVDFTMPSSFPDFGYELYRQGSSTPSYRMARGGTQALDISGPGVGNTSSTPYDLVAVSGSNRFKLATLVIRSSLQRSDGYEWDQSWSVEWQSPQLIVPQESDTGGQPLTPEVTVKSGRVERVLDAPLGAAYPSGTNDTRVVDLSSFGSPQGSDIDVVVRWRRTDGSLVKATSTRVNVSSTRGLLISSASDVPAPEIRYTSIQGTNYLQFESLRNGEGATLWYRNAGTNDNWSSIGFTGGRLSTASLPIANGQVLDFMVESSSNAATRYSGQFRGDTGTPPFALVQDTLTRVKLADQTIVLPLALSNSLTSIPPGSAIDLRVGGVQLSTDQYSVVGAGNALRFEILWSKLPAGLALMRTTAKDLSFSYRISGSVSGNTLLIGAGEGAFRVGPSTSFTTNDLVLYQPVAKLSVPVGLEASIVLNRGDKQVSFAANDAGRWSSDGYLNLNLSGLLTQWGPGDISIAYAGATASFTGVISLSAGGMATVSGLQSRALADGMVKLTVPNAATLPTLKVRETPSGQWQDRVATLKDGAFQWNIPQAEWGKNFEITFEGRDATGNIRYVGAGHYSVNGSGLATYTGDGEIKETSFLRFPASAGTTMSVTMTPRGGGSPQTGSFVRVGDQLWLKLDDLRSPEGNPRDFDYTYERLEGGVLTSKGRGSFRIEGTGKVVPGTTVADRMPLQPIVLQGPKNRPDATKLELRIDGTTTVTLTGVWTVDRMIYTWAQPFGGKVVETPESHQYTLRVLNTAGGAVADEGGEPIVVSGEIQLGGQGDRSTYEVKQYVAALDARAQVVRHQAYNAFGEIVEEYDDATQQRAQAMLNIYKKANLGTFTFDASALRTRFEYNALGKLISKTEPQTFETLANGFVRRITPITTYGYDLKGRLVASIDANGNKTRQSYLAASEQAAVQWTPDNYTRETRYDVFGDARKLSNEVLAGAPKVEIEQDFDKLGRLIVVRRLGIQRVENFSGSAAVGSTLTDSYAYDALGQRISQTNALGFTSLTFYDSLGRVVSTKSAQGAVTSYKYEWIQVGASGRAIRGAGNVDTGGYRRTTRQADDGPLSDDVEHLLTDDIDYFGRTTWHQDLGGRKYTYVYDRAGRLASQTSNAGQDIAYDYLLNGMLLRVTDAGAGTISEYGYDNAGNRTVEAYFERLPGGAKFARYQSSDIQYDELNRLARVRGTDGTHDLRYEYDAVGNRRAAITTYWNPYSGELEAHDELWYEYDAANRFTVSMGQLTMRGTSAGDTNGSIVLDKDSVRLWYDGLGQRIKADVADPLKANARQIEEYRYSTDGYLEDTLIDSQLVARRRVDALGRTAQMRLWKKDTDGHLIYSKTRDMVYDKDNRQMSETVSGSATAGENGTTTYQYYVDRLETAASGGGFGALAKVETLPADPNAGAAVSTTYKYAYWDSAKQSTITKHGPGGDATSQLFYNTNGHQSQLVEGQSRTVNYFNSAQGLVLRREDIRNNRLTYERRFYYAANRRIGEIGNDGPSRVSYAEQLARTSETPKQQRERLSNPAPVTSVDFDQNYEPIGPDYPPATASSYTVRGGDTLSSIAQSVWGDAAMWYLIADANGLRGTETLVEGQVLSIPNKVANIHNNASTFRPYNPGEAIGRVDPTLPDPPPPPMSSGGGCGGLGAFVMIVVAVVVTIYTAGAAAEALGAVTTSGASAFNTGLAVLSGGSAAGVTVTGTAAMVAGAAIGAAAGAIASQVVGMATGNVEKFSWKAVGQSALAAGITAGVGSYFGPAPGATSATANASTLSRVTDAVVRAGVSSAVTQAIQGKWSWREVGAATVSAGAGYFAGQAVADVMSGVDQSLTRFAVSAGAAVGGSWASSQVLGLNTAETRSRLGVAFAAALARGMSDGIGQSFDSASSVYQDNAVARSELRFSNAETSTALELDDRTVELLNGAQSHEPLGANPDDVQIAAADRASIGGGRITIRESKGAVYISDLGGSPVSAPSRPETRILSLSGSSAGEVQSISGERIEPAITSMDEWSGFLTFNPTGKFLRGAGDGALSILQSPVVATIEAATTVTDTLGKGSAAIWNLATGADAFYRPHSALYQSIDSNGVAGTAGSLIKGVVSAPFAPINALYRNDSYALGRSMPDLALAATGPMMAARVQGAGRTGGLGNIDAAATAGAAGPKAPTVFNNQIPESGPRPFAPWRAGGPRSSDFLYVVEPDGNLVMSPIPRNGEYGHYDLTGGGNPVIAAGEGHTYGGKVKLDNASGHYRPEGESAQSAATAAFEKAGFTVTSYTEKVFDFKLGRWVKKQ
ncbi:LysM peptidoglycan-binding domain-containing protein [Roseateles sp.]|uniref:LysM peptidoglycan-binding domain-containing protein n=1 Tax=Roseateles sp. TaxID=1971397 RepID=UPI0031D697F7